jgi:alkylhydroperoxidase family enzyme
MARIPYAPSTNPGADHALNLFRMLAHSPPVSAGFSALGGALLQDSALNPRLRETAIVRVGLLAGASYEVKKHIAIGRAVGLSDAEIGALEPGANQEALTEAGRAVVALADQLFRDVRADDALFDRVKQHFSDRELVELVVTIGFYGLVCRVLETLEVDHEEGWGLPSRLAPRSG